MPGRNLLAVERESAINQTQSEYNNLLAYLEAAGTEQEMNKLKLKPLTMFLEAAGVPGAETGTDTLSALITNYNYPEKDAPEITLNKFNKDFFLQAKSGQAEWFRKRSIAQVADIVGSAGEEVLDSFKPLKNPGRPKDALSIDSATPDEIIDVDFSTEMDELIASIQGDVPNTPFKPTSLPRPFGMGTEIGGY